ncbi:MAG: hypothetical protein EOO04_37925 [Chitinophagaceae bacterium]|nr:MAG: hypothetical protein EOO04_37925 [Chitinophagaceae bacterium]
MSYHPDFFKIFRLTHGSIVFGIVLFSIASILLVEKGLVDTVDISLDRTLQLIVVVIALAMVLGGFRLFKSRIMKIRNSNDPEDKRIENYRSACITWWAMLDIPALFSLVCFILTGNYAFFAVSVFLLLIIIAFMPRKENVILLLNLGSEGKGRFGN